MSKTPTIPTIGAFLSQPHLKLTSNACARQFIWAIPGAGKSYQANRFNHKRIKDIDDFGRRRISGKWELNVDDVEEWLEKAQEPFHSHW